MPGLPLYKQIINDIKEHIFDGTLRPGDRVPSEHELSTAYMVSSITSKNALAELCDKGYIVRHKGKGSFVNSLELLMLIPDFSNSAYSRNEFHSKTIGLIVPSMKTGIDQLLLNYIEEYVGKTDYLLTLVITREDQEQESNAIEKLRAQGACGLIIFPTEHELYNESILRLNLEKYPFVLIDRYLKGIRTNIVCTDNYNVSKQATAHLLDINCKDIVFVSPDSRNTVTEERFNGYKDTLFEHDIVVNMHNACLLPLALQDPLLKKERIAQFLLSNPSIDGIFCANKEMATYIITILHEQNTLNQYHVCAFDYCDHPNVSYIQQDVSMIARECVSVLLENIHGNTDPKQIRVPAVFHKLLSGCSIDESGRKSPQKVT